MLGPSLRAISAATEEKKSFSWYVLDSILIEKFILSFLPQVLKEQRKIMVLEPGGVAIPAIDDEMCEDPPDESEEPVSATPIPDLIPV